MTDYRNRRRPPYGNRISLTDFAPIAAWLAPPADGPPDAPPAPYTPVPGCSLEFEAARRRGLARQIARLYRRLFSPATPADRDDGKPCPVCRANLRDRRGPSMVTLAADIDPAAQRVLLTAWSEAEADPEICSHDRTAIRLGVARLAFDPAAADPQLADWRFLAAVARLQALGLVRCLAIITAGRPDGRRGFRPIIVCTPRGRAWAAGLAEGWTDCIPSMIGKAG